MTDPNGAQSTDTQPTPRFYTRGTAHAAQNVLGRRSVYDRDRPPDRQLLAVAMTNDDADRIVEALNAQEEMYDHPDAC